MKSVVKLMIPKIVDGLDLFKFNEKDETPFDEAEKFKKKSTTKPYMRAATKAWNKVGRQIQKIIYLTCEQLPAVLIDLICSYLPTQVRSKSERDEQNAKLNPIEHENENDQ
jgi:hypothetical protein